MKRQKFAVLLLLMIWTTGFSQSLSLQIGVPFQNPNLDIQWDAPAKALPSTVWSYRILPRKFSTQAISNLVAECGLTESDKAISNAEEIVYKNATKPPSKFLGISAFHGVIYYQTVTDYGPTNFAKNVPATNQMQPLTTNFLAGFGINIRDIEKNKNGGPGFRFWEPLTEYDIKGTIVTNTEFRAVDFRRSVDGGNVLGAGTAGDGHIEFGENGRPVKIDITWPDLERYKSYAAASPETIKKWIREGKARQGGLPMNLNDLDWATVKSLTVKKAEICYYAGNRFSPSPWLIPLISLWTTVDTGTMKVNVEIDCPIIDESQL